VEQKQSGSGHALLSVCSDGWAFRSFIRSINADGQEIVGPNIANAAADVVTLPSMLANHPTQAEKVMK